MRRLTKDPAAALKTPHFKTEARTPAEARDWISAEDVIRHALAAYYAKCSRDQRDLDNGTAEGITVSFCRLSFADELTEYFRARLHAQGFERQAYPFHDWAAEYLRDW